MHSKFHGAAIEFGTACRAAMTFSSRSPSLFVALPALFFVVPSGVVAQERYDDHEIMDRIYVTLGAYRATNTNSTLQVRSKRTGLGALVDVEEFLDVEQSVTVARLDGFYRFNRAHRFEWSYFDQTRDGTVMLEDDLEIGDLIIPLEYTLTTEWKFRLIKASYAWSFINTAKYEFYLGAGLNVRSTTLRMRGEGDVGGIVDVRVFDETANLPLLTATIGLRYRVTDRLTFDVKSETFFLEIGDASGRLQNNYFLADYRIGRHVGIGGGVNFFGFDIEADFNDDDVFNSHTDNIGFQLFVSAQF